MNQSQLSPKLIKQLRSAVDNVQLKELPAAIAQTLPEMNAQLIADPRRDENIKALSKGQALCVVTGQQLGLFLGPVYTLYKTLTAIALAKKLEQELGQKVVPIFWLQSEDHDVEEISTAQLLDRESQIVELKNEIQESLGPVSIGSRTLPATTESLIENIREYIGFYPEAEQVLELVQKHYSNNALQTKAFAGLLAEILPNSGLVFFNPRHDGVSEAFLPIFTKALDDHETINSLLQQSSETIIASGQQPQVYIRQKSPLLFFHEQSAQAPRFRIQLSENQQSWDLVGGGPVHSIQEMKLALERSPERFSCSALLRPILQDFLFPTAAYVAGNAEINYFKQISTLYSHFGVQQSVAVPRAHFTVVERKAKKWLEELDLNISAFSNPDIEVEKLVAAKLATDLPAPAALEAEITNNIKTALEPLVSAIRTADPTLYNSLQKTKEKIDKTVAPLFKRYEQAILRREGYGTERLQKLQNIIVPDGHAQERILSSIYFLCRFGPNFTTIVEESIDFDNNEFVELNL